MPFKKTPLELPSNNMPQQKMNRHSTSRSPNQTPSTLRMGREIDRSLHRGQPKRTSPEPSNPPSSNSDSDSKKPDVSDRRRKRNKSPSTTQQPENPQMEPDSKQQGLEEELSITIEESAKPYACNFCPKRYLAKGSCDNHMRTHTGERPFVCDICDKTFTVKSSLQLHLKIHTKEKPFSCKFCNKSFLQKVSLQQHRRMHTGEKCYICKICNEGFIWPVQLKRHTIMKHKGIEGVKIHGYECNVCHKICAQKYNLKVHMATHADKRPHLCTICGASYVTNTGLQRHKRNKHANGTSDTGPDSKDKLYEQDIKGQTVAVIDSESDFGKGLSHIVDYHPEEVYIPVVPGKVENEHDTDPLHEKFSQKNAWQDSDFEEIVKTEPFIEYEYDSN